MDLQRHALQEEDHELFKIRQRTVGALRFRKPNGFKDEESKVAEQVHQATDARTQHNTPQCFAPLSDVPEGTEKGCGHSHDDNYIHKETRII